MNKGYVGANLALKIADMKAAGNISPSDETFLQILRQIGNASTHAISAGSCFGDHEPCPASHLHFAENSKED